MKNLCLLVCSLIVISALPTYATKIIVNDNQDRIVYSRSSLPNEAVIYEESTINNPEQTMKYYGNKNQEQSDYQRNLLGNDFRLELAGTKWNMNDNNMPVNYHTYTSNSEFTARLDRIKRGSREAADYYYVDIIKAPNTLIPSGYAE